MRHRGFTLLEVLIALAIVGGLLVTLIYTLNYHLSIVGRHETITTATLLAKNKLLDMEKDPEEKKGVFDEPYKGYTYETFVKESPYPGISEIIVVVRADKEEVKLNEFLNKRGFTLIEVLIATTILSVVLAAIYSTFFLSHRAMEGMDEHMLKIQESRKALDILRRELDSVYFDSGDKYTSFKIEDRDIYGKQATQLTFTTFSTLRPGLSRISYYIEEKDGKLNLFKKIESPYFNENNREETQGVDIIENIEAFAIEAIYNDNWVKTWDTEIIQGLPEKLRISLTIKIKGRDVILSDMSRPRIGRRV